MLCRSQLHDYQTETVNYIVENERVFLMLDLGMGKTVSTLTAISDLINAMLVNRVLVVAPLRVAQSVWKQETEKWEHLKDLTVSLAIGTPTQRKNALNAKSEICVINRENIPWLLTQYKANNWPFDVVVIDESSSFKNSSTKRFKALKKVAPLVDYWVNLSATPSPNSLLELWPQAYFIDFGESLGKTMTGFKQRFFNSDYMGYSWEPKEGSADKIRQLMKPYSISMKASDHLDIVEPVTINIAVDLPKAVTAQYEELENDLVLDLESDSIEIANAAALANKLLQVCNGAIYTEESHEVLHDEKLEALAELIEQNPNENIFLAYNFKTDAERILKRFPQAVKMEGDKTVTDWNNGKIKLLIAHPASCGHGLNLQKGGSMVVWFGLTWSLELYLQLNGRIYRQGQTQLVRFVHLITKGTIEERVLEVLESKEETQSKTIEFFKRLIK